MGHFGGAIRVRHLICEELRGVAGEALAVGCGRVRVGLLLRGPIVQSHKLAVGRAVLRGERGARLAKTMGAAFR